MSDSSLLFHFMAVSSRDPIPVPERVRKPLTQVQEFNLHVDHRAVDRAEFDHKVPKIIQIFLGHVILWLLERHGIFSTHKVYLPG